MKVGVYKTIIHCMPGIILSTHITKVSITDIAKIFIVQAMVFPVVMYGCEVGLRRRLCAEELMLLNCGVGEES